MPQVPQAFKRESLLCNRNVYKGLSWDFSNRYLEVKNSNKKTSEFHSLFFCLNLWSVLSSRYYKCLHAWGF